LKNNYSKSHNLKLELILDVKLFFHFSKRKLILLLYNKNNSICYNIKIFKIVFVLLELVLSSLNVNETKDAKLLVFFLRGIIISYFGKLVFRWTKYSRII